MTDGAPFRYVIGIDPDPDLTASEVAAFGEFYDTIHQPEVVAANEGFLACHRLEALNLPADDRCGPRWLAFYAISDLAGVREYVSRQRVPGAGMSYTPGPILWTRMTTIWRAILTVAAGPRDVTLGQGPILLSASGPDSGSAEPTTTFEVCTELGGLSSFPSPLTARAAAGPAEPGPHPTWSRHYRRTGTQS
ncbi:MAG TPA: hypothetical protein VMU94_24815 [Streptosporangiaceae bacterium]|nr:hypothetical protein [Streptosporangiaceae bacterium]